MKKIKKLRQDKKGFTLVELIVVLVILAILAAILVPALLGYIDKAKEKQIVLDAKSALTATQAQFSEYYASDITDINSVLKDTGTEILENLADVQCDSFVVYTDVSISSLGKNPMASQLHKAYTIVGAEYVENGITMYLVNGSWVSSLPVNAFKGKTSYKVK